MAQEAREICRELVERCKQHVKQKTSVVFDPTTGVQKTFVAGKLTEVKHFEPRKVNDNSNP